MKYLAFIALCLLPACSGNYADSRTIILPSFSGNPKSITAEDVQNIGKTITKLKNKTIFIQHIYVHDSSFVEVTTSEKINSFTGDYFYLIKNRDTWIENPKKKRKVWIE